MKAFYQGNILEENQINLLQENRSFLYGDGLFETITASGQQVKYLSYHLQRIREGLKILSIKASDFLEHEKMHQIINQLHVENKIENIYRIKLICWRSPGGTYSPTGSECETLVTVKNIDQPKIKTSKNVSFSESIKNTSSIFSKFKTTNALKYVLAGIEKNRKGLDDIIITDEKGNISECLISNIFWIKNDQWFTPSLETGCIEGTSRRVIFKEAGERGINILEVKATKEDLLSADSIFSTNSSGIQHILSIDNCSFNTYKLIEDIYQPF